MDSYGAIAVVRGCGERVEGGIYAECGLTPAGRPLDEFLCDPPREIPDDMIVVNRGVTLWQHAKSRTWHIVDRIGTEHYPSPLDVVEEVRRFGASRRLSPRLTPPRDSHPPACHDPACTKHHSGFEFLTKRSTLILIHAHAYIANYGAYWAATLPQPCPTAIFGHPPPELADLPGPVEATVREFVSPRPPPGEFCVTTWGDDFTSDDVVAGGRFDWKPPFYLRPRPSFQYPVRLRPAGLIACYEERIFMVLPLQRLVVVDGESAAESYAAAQVAKVPVLRVSE